jgi:hypothetical protein
LKPSNCQTPSTSCSSGIRGESASRRHRTHAESTDV